MVKKMQNTGSLSAEAVASRAFRVRVTKEGDNESGLSRYGILPEQPDCDNKTDQTESFIIIETEDAGLTVSKSDGLFTLSRADGKTLVSTVSSPKNGPDGFELVLTLGNTTRVYGLGDVTRERIEKNGFKTAMFVKNVDMYVPIPVIFTSDGWGLFLNTTWRHTFDIGASDKNELRITGRGALDVYLFAGGNYRALLDIYTKICGRPAMLPRWAYGLMYVCNQQVNAREMMDDCLNFRREGIPCDIVGLEPGWMEKFYDFSLTKNWHPERFYVPDWYPKGDQTFFGALNRQNFKLSLWLCCDYDLSFEEERLLENNAAADADGMADNENAFEKDVRLSDGVVMMDKITKTGEPWFEHLKKFVDQGASCFKLDGANQVQSHPDRKWGNGMDDEEMHNLYPVILNKQMSAGFSGYTGRRAMIYSSGGYAGIQRYSATWAGDTGGGPKPLVSMLNHGFSGHCNVSCDMDVFSAEGIHFGFFQTWSQLCNWAYWRQPWFLTDNRKAMYKFYARLRYRLLPYIYSAAYEAHLTGFPVMRAMPMAYPGMPGADALLYQYMFGNDLLTGAFTERVSLPEGRWTDAWTGEVLNGGATIDCRYPEWAGGPLYIREGAVIPTCEDAQWIGEDAPGRVTLNIYPCGIERTYTLYEDDGVSLDYVGGMYAETEITSFRKDGKIYISIAKRKGHFTGMPETRGYTINLYNANPVGKVLLNGVPVKFSASNDSWCAPGTTPFTRVELAETNDAAELEIFEDEI